jgi:hypothetical protein
VERLVTVVFGPARSTRFAAAVAEAERGPGICSEIEPGRYRASFLLDRDAACYRGLARLLERVRHWRATEVYDDDDEPVSVYHAREMGWCASSQLGWFGDCRVRFFHGVLSRCALCPLFDVERAVRDVLGENTPNTIEVRLPARVEAILAGEEPPPPLAPPLDPDWRIPDSPPAEWRQQLGEEPREEC